MSLQAATYAPEWAGLNLCPPEDDDPAFLTAAVEELAKVAC